MTPTIKVHGRVIPLSYVNGEWRANVEIHLRDTDNEEEISRLVEFLREVRRELKKISSTILH